MRAQRGEQRQERQTQNGEMVALDLLEQLHPGALELIAADARRHRLAGRIEIAVEEIVGQSPHGEAGPVDVVEQDVAVARDRNGRVERVDAAGQRSELRAGGGAVCRLGETPIAERERLVGTDHQPARQSGRDAQGLFARQ